MNKEKSNGNSDMYYETMDHDKGPILEFKSIDKDSYQLNSIWENFKCTEPILREDILNGVRSFQYELKKEFHEKYKVNVERIKKNEREGRYSFQDKHNDKPKGMST